MTLTPDTTKSIKLPAVPAPVPAAPWPKVSNEVDLIISAIEAGSSPTVERRAMRRHAWRAQATVRLFIDQAHHPVRVVYSRDIHSRGLGFVTPERLPLGYGGVLDLPAKDGSIVSVACTVLRCRMAAPGWYEGFVYFNREQTDFERLIN